RQPRFCAIRPPNRAAKPDPPHDPIDHSDTARWRPAPCQYAFTNASEAGMMKAPDKPWQIRPSVRKVEPIGPVGASASNSEPVIENTNPHWTVLILPKRSASPPMTTMKMPENKAVMETAMFIRVG